MDYRKELETLMGETATLVAHNVATASEATRPPVLARTYKPVDLVVSILSEPSRPTPHQYNFGPPEREQIIKRVENFKAHQERFQREREDYFLQTMQRVRDLVEGKRLPGD